MTVGSSHSGGSSFLANTSYHEGGSFLDPQSMWNNGLFGSFEGLRAVVLHALGVQVTPHCSTGILVMMDTCFVLIAYRPSH